MVTIMIEVDDHGLAAGFKSKAAAISIEEQRLLKDLVRIGEKWVKREAPVKTGKLRGKVMSTVSTNGGSIFVPKGAVKYFDFVIDGTRPHDIVPKHAQALYWPGAKHPVKKVRHPGTKSNPFFDKALTSMDSEFNARLEKFAEWLGDI